MYSASGQSLAMMDRQAMRGTVFGRNDFLSSDIATYLRDSSPSAVRWRRYSVGVLFFGEASKGAQRWLNFGFVRFQPSELLKLAVPLMLARFIGKRSLPTFQTLAISLVMVFVPTILIAKQPDLGTSILIAASGIFVIF
ncbi:FtsW/RodA/SpoVE family cell cycle protein [Vibrio chagasii]|nr:FtsW/RodA/SpoVE family cell cycle protein [Vibrio chagasii]